MSYSKDYGNGGSMSSSGDKPKTKKGTPYTDKNPYSPDMYDTMAPANKSASGPVNTGIQGGSAAVASGNTQDGSQKWSPKFDGQNHYGKGNPYDSPAPGKGGKPDKSAKPVSEKKQVAKPGKAKQKFSSLAELREYAKGTSNG